MLLRRLTSLTEHTLLLMEKLRLLEHPRNSSTMKQRGISILGITFPIRWRIAISRRLSVNAADSREGRACHDAELTPESEHSECPDN